MPGYKTHDRIGVITAISTSTVAIITTPIKIVDIVIYAAAVIVGTMWLSPDLDTDSMIYSRWGIFKWYWMPYKELVSHRSWLSHSGPLSATIRLLYLITPLLMCMFLLPYTDIKPYQVQDAILTYGKYFGIIWLGFIIADVVHTAADYITTGVKRARF